MRIAHSMRGAIRACTGHRTLVRQVDLVRKVRRVRRGRVRRRGKDRARRRGDGEEVGMMGRDMDSLLVG
jgi:hypothetical protein